MRCFVQVQKQQAASMKFMSILCSMTAPELSFGDLILLHSQW